MQSGLADQLHVACEGFNSVSGSAGLGKAKFGGFFSPCSLKRVNVGWWISCMRSVMGYTQ